MSVCWHCMLCAHKIINLYLPLSTLSCHQWEQAWILQPGLRPNRPAGSRGCLDKHPQWSVGLWCSSSAENHRHKLRSFTKATLNATQTLCFGHLNGLLFSSRALELVPDVILYLSSSCINVLHCFNPWNCGYFQWGSLSQWKHMGFNGFWQHFKQECGLPDHQRHNYTMLKINRRIDSKRHGCRVHLPYAAKHISPHCFVFFASKTPWIKFHWLIIPCQFGSLTITHMLSKRLKKTFTWLWIYSLECIDYWLWLKTGVNWNSPLLKYRPRCKEMEGGKDSLTGT